jgi:hypothetical protein
LLYTQTMAGPIGGFGGGAGVPALSVDARLADAQANSDDGATDVNRDGSSDRSNVTPLDGGECDDGHVDVCTP